MSNSPADIRSDLQRIYELSLSIGNSLDPNKVCHEFTSALMRQNELNYIGIWIFPEKQSPHTPFYKLHYAFPYSRAIYTELPTDNLAFSLDDQDSFTFGALSDSLPQSQLVEEDSINSHYAIFRLGSLGYIRLLRDQSSFTQRELRQLRPLIEKLFIALGGALAYTQLHTERAFLTSLIDTIPDLIWLKDSTGKYLACNAKFETFFGAKEHQIVGKGDHDFVDSQLADFFLEKDREVLAAGKSLINQEWVTFADSGEEVLLETIKTPMEISQNDLMGVLGVSRDITPLHTAQQALKESEAFFRSYFELGLIGMALISAKGEWVKVNRYLSEMLGYHEDSLSGATLANYLHPDDLNRFEQMLEQLHQKECDSTRTEIRFISKSGPTVHSEIAMSTQQTESGAPHFVTLVSDITERRRAEQQLRLAASVFEHASEGVMITDNKGLIIDVNHAFQKLTGYSAHEVIGRTPSMLKSGHHSEEFFASMWQSLQQDKHWRGEVWNRNKSGEIYAELLNIAAVQNNNGETSHFVSIFSDITQLKEHQHELEKMAHFDALTQLPNRVLLSDRLKSAINNCPADKMMAVAYIDLDEFKPINDTYGHDIGDLLLIEVSDRMAECLDKQNEVARLGGDEFIVLLTNLTSASQCQEALAKLISTLSAPFFIKHNELKISASIGVTLYPEDNADPDTLIRHADQAMYTAKQTGRNRYHFFDPAFDRQTQDQQKAQDEISQALLNREFVLFYQPKINMRTGRVYGVEALIRWQHPTLNLLPPDSFLPYITDPEVANSLGNWVLDEAISQLRIWRSAGLNLTTSINISAQHLQSHQFPEQLAQLLDKYPEVPPHTIELEVLETAAFDDVNAATEIIEKCHLLGVRFALDDFGTGYSSLTYLRKFPADTVKIDRSFVMDMLDDDEDKAIVEGIIGLGEAFQREIIAEGVESAAHGRCLLQMGCDHAQGFGIAKPMPADLIPDWVSTFRLDEHWN